MQGAGKTTLHKFKTLIYHLMQSMKEGSCKENNIFKESVEPFLWIQSGQPSLQAQDEE
jgi:hypothetical protein